jgi:hypothetical protein
MHNEYIMKNAAAITIRLPASLKRDLERRAERAHRSVSAQVVADLERILNESQEEKTGGKFLGIFSGTPLPTDEDIKEARALLWGKIGSR